MVRKLGVLVGVLVILGFVSAQNDAAYLSLEPLGIPLEHVSVSPGDAITLYLVFHNASAPASSVNIPIHYGSPIEIVGFGFTADSWYDPDLWPDVCMGSWQLYPHHDPDDRYATWCCWAASYPACDIPCGSLFDMGWITFYSPSFGMSEVTEGLGPTGAGLEYVDGSTMTTCYPDWVELVIESAIPCEESNVRRLPRSNYLRSPEPNPFTGSTRISFGIRTAQHVRLTVYDPAGRAVRTLVDGNRESGHYDVTWNGRSDDGRYVPSGVYIFRLSTPDRTESRRLVLWR
jgi:hypothetical protein